MSNELIFMGGFLLLVVAMLAVDLGLVNRRDHVVTLREALVWTGVWIGTALLFYVFLLLRAELLHGVTGLSDADLTAYRREMSLEYLTGYLIEKALSVDNIFVMIVIFRSFCVDPKHYHKVLFWGVAGAIVMRFVFIFAGVALIERFEWVLWVFGAFLVFTGIKMFFEKQENSGCGIGEGGEGGPGKKDITQNRLVKFARKHFHLPPLLLVVLVIEGADVIFAVDSIPAIFSVTLDPYIVFFSNIFAILGLRSLFFVLSGVMDRFAYLKTGLAVLLTFIGVKMLLHGIFHIDISTGVSLVVIVGILAISIIASMIFSPKARPTD